MDPTSRRRRSVPKVTQAPGSWIAAIEQRPADPVLPLSSFARPDYVDLFVMTGGLTADSPRRWAAAMFEKEAGLAGQVIWRLVLGMRLARRGTANHIAGWSIGASDDNWIRLEADGPLMSGNLIVRADHDQVWLATVVRYNRRLGSGLWRALSIIHRRTASSLLRDTLTRLGNEAERPEPSQAR